MHRRLYALASPLALLFLASGCVQATRHSNTMVFGTNTTFGIKVGTSANQVPSITVGYDRQEAVIMPLVANASGATGHYGDDLLQPCDLTAPINVSGEATYAVHPCSLVAVNGSALDSYSVLASFGANFDGSANTSQVGAKGGLAQYFATGMAAQLLAANGGAAVVAVGEAATESARNPISDEAVASMFGNPTSFGLGVAAAKTFPDFRSTLLANLAAVSADADVKTKIAAFETTAGIQTEMRATCATKQACIGAVNDGEYDQWYAMNTAKMDEALKKW